MKKKILITGGSGFIGFNLLNKLKKYNFQIYILSSKSSRRLKLIKNINYIICDIRDKKKLKKLFSNRFEIIINLAGNIDHSNNIETLKTHYNGCKNLIDLVDKKKIELFLQIGSSLEYGKSKSAQKENLRNYPYSIYGKSKLLATKYLLKKGKEKKFSHIVLRLYQVYGPNQKFDRLIPYAIKCCLKNKKFNCSEGKQIRDFLYVDDLTDLIVKILKKEKIKSGIYNVGSGKPIKIRKVIELINKKIKLGHPLFGKIKMRSDEVLSLYPNISKIKKEFNWQPKVNLLNGLSKTIKSYKKNLGV